MAATFVTATPYDCTLNDDLIVVATGGGRVNLPDITRVPPLRTVYIDSRIASLTVGCFGSQTIEGGSTTTIGSNGSEIFMSDGSVWRIVSQA